MRHSSRFAIEAVTETGERYIVGTTKTLQEAVSHVMALTENDPPELRPNCIGLWVFTPSYNRWREMLVTYTIRAVPEQEREELL